MSNGESLLGGTLTVEFSADREVVLRQTHPEYGPQRVHMGHEELDAFLKWTAELIASWMTPEEKAKVEARAGRMIKDLVRAGDPGPSGRS